MPFLSRDAVKPRNKKNKTFRLNIKGEMCESMDPPTPNFSPTSMDRLNNNTKELAIIPRPPSSTSQADFTRSRELMGALCTANPQFTASVLEDYIRPIFRFLPIHNL